jgi:hypothetical protein
MDNSICRKNLFFDTCAIIKFFIDETGSDYIKWLCNSNTRRQFGLHFSTSVYVRNEFFNVIDKFQQNSRIIPEKADRIRRKSRLYFIDFFNIRDSEIKPGEKFNVANADSLISKYNLDPLKNNGDAKILSCMINYMRFYVQTSRPHVITSDKKFQKIIKAEGFCFIDPEKATTEETESYFLSL